MPSLGTSVSPSQCQRIDPPHRPRLNIQRVTPFMPTNSRKSSLIILICLLLAGPVAIDTAFAQTKSIPPPKTTQRASQAEDAQADADEQDATNDELEAAAVTIDVSRSSPLIQKLYQATRETNEQ